MRRRIGGRFAEAATGASVALRSGRGPRIIIGIHGVDCAACASYVARLGAERAALEEWGARLTAVAPLSRHDPAADLRASAAQLLFSDDDIETTLGVAPPALIIADEWGEVYFTVRAEHDHDLPEAAEVIEWIRFVSIQCPECENPEGEWRSL